MPALITYADTENRFHDTRKITLDKILQALNDGAGGGAGSGGALSGDGAPGAGTGSNGNIYVDRTNRDMYVKIAGAWEIWVDIA
jgi:hypothetical protein